MQYEDLLTQVTNLYVEPFYDYPEILWQNQSFSLFDYDNPTLPSNLDVCDFITANDYGDFVTSLDFTNADDRARYLECYSTFLVDPPMPESVYVRQAASQERMDTYTQELQDLNDLSLEIQRNITNGPNELN